MGFAPDGYPDAATIIDGSTVEALTSLEPDQLEALRVASIAAVEDFCGQSLAAVVATVKVPGTGTDELLLPRRLASLTTVSLGDVPLVLGEVVLTEDHDRIAFGRSWGGGWLPQAEAEALGQDTPHRSWPIGVDNVLVDGTWGYAEDDPAWAAITAALRIDMENQVLADSTELGDSLRAYRTLGIASLSQGNLSVTFSGAGGGGGGAGAGATLPDRSVALLQGAGCVWAAFGVKAWGGLPYAGRRW